MRKGVPQRTFLGAVGFIRAVVLTVVEVVAEQIRVDAAATEAPELVLLTNWSERKCCWKTKPLNKQLFLSFFFVMS